MGNTTNHLLLCVSQSSRKNRRERPYVSRPFWPYEYEHHLNVSNVSSQIREISPIRLSPTTLRETSSESRSMHTIKKT